MPNTNTPSQVAMNALQAIPFSSMIGGPLKACIEAQAMAAKTTWDFIQEVGLNTNSETGEKSAVNVAFTFIQNGRQVQLNVPLLTIVPIPYIAIHNIDINFKANISASASTVSESHKSAETGVGASISGGFKLGPFHMDAALKANYSSKKDSKATEESKYCVEYTMDIAVKAGQESMPAGLAKVLELLGNSLDISDPNGTLEVNSTMLKVGDDLIITFKNKSGLFAPKEILIRKGTDEIKVTDELISGDSIVLKKVSTGTYILTAGRQTINVEVVGSSGNQE